MIRQKYLKNLIFSLFIVIGVLSLFKLGLAQGLDIGTNEINSTIQLGSEDPRAIAARVINVALLFFGVIGVIIVIIGGYKWMTSGGDETKVKDALRLLRNAVIGLAIILMAWGIASFVLNQLMGATGNSSNPNSVCTVGALESCGCNGSRTCLADESWGPCVGSNCGGDSQVSCNLNPEGACTADPSKCDEDSTCNSISCLCEPKASIGESCDADISTPTCEANSSACGPYLQCDPAAACTCQGAPIIMDISPAGGFCKNNANKPCEQDGDCVDSTCDLTTPNGASGNLVTISGFNFGSFVSGSKVVFEGSGNNQKDAAAPPLVCAPNAWSDRQIIVAIPDDVPAGALKVIRGNDNKSDSSLDDLGPKMPPFQPNSISRPGICSLDPGQGSIGGNIIYQGIKFKDSAAYFGTYKQSVAASKSMFESEQIGAAQAPSLKSGNTSTFVIKKIDGFPQKSNYLSFKMAASGVAEAFISDFSPRTGKSGQYVTIVGKGFGAGRGTSTVFFKDVNGLKKEASFDFPEVCTDSIWKDSQIIVKVPDGISSGNFLLEINLQLNNKIIDSGSVLPSGNFLVNQNLNLSPSLCKISPAKGLASSPVALWGEYFGNAGSLSSVYFYNNKVVNSQVVKEAKAQRINTNVPQDATTGPVKIKNATDFGNSLNFSIGECASDAECSPDVCCPPTTYKKGQCVANLSQCVPSVKNSVFQWKFSTPYSGYTGTDTFYSCNGQAQALGACQVNQTCPNAPGKCSPFDASGTALGNCCGAGFTYNKDLAKCVANQTCDLAKDMGTCGDVKYGGKTYPTVLIGEQCWFAENLNIGTMISLTQAGQNNDGLIEKYCYDNDIDNCAIYGGLYKWAEVMGLPNSCNNSNCSIGDGQGLCPEGWRIPSDDDWKDLERHLGMEESELNKINFRGTDQGKKLKPGGSSNFNALPVIDLMGGQTASFSGLNSSAVFLSSTKNSSNNRAIVRYLNYTDASAPFDQIYRNSAFPSSIVAYSARCVQDKADNQQVLSREAVCKKFAKYGDKYHWELTAINCPNGWTNIGGGKCIDSTDKNNSSCSVCPDGLKCLDNNTGGQQGVCGQDTDCAAGTTCNNNDGKCYGQSSCQCCCQIGFDARDCCAPLKCSGTCGSDVTNDNAGFGKCGGCAAVGTTAAEHDAACNCSGHSGQYCDTKNPDFPQGVCTDCDSLSAEDCNSHSSSCCLDAKKVNATGQATCRSGSGETVSNIPGNPNFGYCAYYDCTGPLCNADNPVINGVFANIDSCNKGCVATGDLSHCSEFNNDFDKCKLDPTCCYNQKNGNCLSGERLQTGQNLGYCAYYNCTDPGGAANTCDVSNPVPDGDYRGQALCQQKCVPGTSGPGLDCSGASSNTCQNLGFCSGPFKCIGEDGNEGSPQLGCGTCCCEVSDANSCALPNVPAGVVLKCTPDQAPCSGAGRGLCCGCKDDNECGSEATIGCDANACCRQRPEVITSETKPAELAENVCRNTAIRVTFNQEMNESSLLNNILLLEERDPSTPCPAGTFLAASDEFKLALKPRNFLEKMWQPLASLGNKIGLFLGIKSAVLAVEPDPDNIYCAVSGISSLEKNGSRHVLVFSPTNLLSPQTNYFLVVKGDENLDSSGGVLSFYNVGLNGAGLKINASGTIKPGSGLKFNNISYANSYISTFKTISDQGPSAGICAVDHVQISPSSFLFQTNINDLNEKDDSYSEKSFDTVKDGDKVFSAWALSANNQYLSPVNGYNWDWNWSTDNTTTVDDLSSSVNWQGVSNRAFIRAKSSVTDGSVSLKAKVNMSAYSNFSLVGDGTEKNAPVYVFVCNNPWPAVNSDLTWTPWSDQSNFNYKFYYCRDAGKAGTSDDLPAISSNPVTKGQSANFICSDGGAPCQVPGDPCGQDKNGVGGPDGFCISNWLREVYFFRSPTPETVTISNLNDLGNGGSVRIEWKSNSDLIYVAPTVVGSYKIYYGLVGGGQTIASVKPNLPVANPVCSPANPSPGTDYICSTIISGLNIDQEYSFRVSALTPNNAESFLSDEAKVTPTDKTTPQQPGSFGAGF